MRARPSPPGPFPPRPARISFSSVKLPVSASSCSSIPELEPRRRNGRQRNGGNSAVRRHPFEEAVKNAEAFLKSAWAKWESEAEKVKALVGTALADRARGWDRAVSAAVCSLSLARAAEIDSSPQQGKDSIASRRPDRISADRIPGGERDRRRGNGAQGAQEVGAEEERVLISEILIQDKDGQEVEDKELLATVQGALKACKPNFALTTTEVQEDVHRIIDTGFFASCMPSAEDTRDGVRLIFKVGFYILSSFCASSNRLMWW